MKSTKSIGRIIGLLLALQLPLGLILPFVLIQGPLSIVPPGFLVNAAADSSRIHLAVLIAFVGGALTVSIAITAYQVIRRNSQTMALWFLVLCVTSLAMDAIHNTAVMSMLSISERFAEAGSADAGLFQALGETVRSARYWAHYTQLVFIGGWIFMFYVIMLRFGLIPRLLATLGLIGILLQFIGVTLPALLDYPSMPWLAYPLAPIHLTAAIWLTAKGFDEQHRLPDADA